MFQIDNASVAAAQPPSTAPGVAGFFTDGNPVSNTPATIVPAEWLNAMMLELMNAVTGTGQTLNKAAFNQLLTAIQTASQNPGVTPPQFDSSTKTATTAFVQRALGNTQGDLVLTGTAAIPAANWGSYVEMNLTANATITLPTPNVKGGTFLFHNNSGYTATLSLPSGAFYGPGGNNAATLAVPAYSAINVVCDGLNLMVLGGVFSPNAGANGYQKFLGGILLEWGIAQTNTSGIGAITFPIAFPNASLVFTATIAGSTGVNPFYTVTGGATGSKTSQAFYAFLTTTGAAASTYVYWIAIGN